VQLAAIDDAAWSSPWRNRQVGEKAALSLGLLLTALVAPVWPGSVLVAVASLVAMAVLARIDVRVLAAALAAPTVFILVGAASVAVGVGAAPGDAWGHLGWFWVGPSGLAQAARLLGHGIAGTLATLLLATTTPMVDLLTAARRLRVPDALIEVSSLTYRLLWVLLGTTLAVHEAQLARLGDAAGRRGLRSRMQAAGDTVGSVLVRSWDRARRMEAGLAGRGYERSLPTLSREVGANWVFRCGAILTLSGIWGVVAWLQ